MAAAWQVVWIEEGGERRWSKPLSYEPRARWICQQLMVRPTGPKVLEAEIRRGGVTYYRTTAEEWEGKDK